MARPHVLLLSTGGTIASLGHDRLDLSDYGSTGRTVTAASLLAGLPEVAQLARVEPRQVIDRPSHDVAWGDILAVARAVSEAAGRGDVTGVVVTHGTNTLEETAFALDLVCEPGLPVVVTGAMRPASAVSADGPANLLNAVRLAVSDQARGLGVLVALNETILTARDATKGATSGVGAFHSPGIGPVGRIQADGAVVIDRRPAAWSARGRFRPAPADLPRVDVVTSYLGCDGTHVDASAAGARGIVVAGMGAGYLPAAQEQALVRAAEGGVRVCLASRTGSGAVVRRDVEVLIPAGDLNPWKARILLACGIAADLPDAELRELFAVPHECR